MSQAKQQTIAEFKVQYLQFLNAASEATQAFPDFANDKTLLELYRLMTLVRTLDNKAFNLQRTGKMGTYPSAQGQEAVGIGMGHAMQKEDVFCPYYRDQAVMMQRGIKLSEILAYWGGDERGSHYENNAEDFPVCVPIGTQLLHAAGVAYAIKLRQQKRAVVTACGEGGTSQGDFYEAINVAGAWNLPLVFVVNNNQWAISVPTELQTRCETFAQKAIAAGFEGIQVDGNDVIAMRQAMDNALNKARKGDGPTLIEAVTYRLCDHTTADDASRYIPDADRKAAWKKEPIARLGHYLEAKGLWSREQEATLQQNCKQEVEAATQEYLSLTPQAITDIFDYLYAELPDALIDQRDALMEQNT